MTPARCSGIALIEAVIAITIVAIAASAILSMVSHANSHGGRSGLQLEAAAIAAAYLNEIAARPYVDPDGNDGETSRALFDDLDDYAGLTDNAARDVTGALLPGGARFRVEVGIAPSGALPGVPA
ncbi:MAG: hypothetical protein NZM12_12000, partial [Steroidobacteraceae bacterium]|nr:hypothetical protein [Steroidobacteraceae bacterium]MDW8260869.1 hypothetical protein [Gammaproteobacteria bacterium]